jgi:hypothetical protein
MKNAAIVALLLCSSLPFALAEEPFAPVNDPVRTARTAGGDVVLAMIYEDTELRSRRVGFEDDNRTVFLWDDSNSNGKHDDGETYQVANFGPLRFTVPYAAIHGNVTDDVSAMGPERLQVRICVEDAQYALAPPDGLAVGIRCGGDVDQDGEGDVSEVARNRNPVQSGSNAPLVPLLP